MPVEEGILARAAVENTESKIRLTKVALKNRRLDLWRIFASTFMLLAGVCLLFNSNLLEILTGLAGASSYKQGLQPCRLVYGIPKLFLPENNKLSRTGEVLVKST